MGEGDREEDREEDRRGARRVLPEPVWPRRIIAVGFGEEGKGVGGMKGVISKGRMEVVKIWDCCSGVRCQWGGREGC